MRYLVTIALVFMLALPVTAQDFHKSWAAYQRGDSATALRAWRPIAEQGNAGAQNNLGFMYANGDKGDPRDYAEALPVAAQDFDKGFAAYIADDYVGALREWRPLAKQGAAEAQFWLGGMYLEGHGVPQNYTEAANWFHKAAEQVHPASQYELGLLYLNARGRPQDYVLAHMWMSLAITFGYDGETANRNHAIRQMSPDQNAKAQRFAREWMEKHGK